jgi:iron complex outermembrane recepter protein
VFSPQNSCTSMRFPSFIPGCLLLVLSTIPKITSAQEPQQDLTKLNIEDLMKVEVTSVSKREQTLSETAAAVFVISQEDIRRSGATNIPDLLRMVPGVYVAQINSNTWAICIRAFNEGLGRPRPQLLRPGSDGRADAGDGWTHRNEPAP